jgi:hypothetical protein
MAPGTKVIKQEITEPVFIPMKGVLQCLKCGKSVLDYKVVDHLMQCQPEGAKCGKCGEIIPPAEFLSHFNICKGPVEKVTVIPSPVCRQPLTTEDLSGNVVEILQNRQYIRVHRTCPTEKEKTTHVS